MAILQMILTYVIVFGVGGAFCMGAEVLIIKTRLTPARILVLFLLLGILLEAVGVYRYIFAVAKSGVSVPIVGFGAALAKGAIKYARTYGFLGAFAGGLLATAFGIGVAVVMSFLVTLIFSSRSK